MTCHSAELHHMHHAWWHCDQSSTPEASMGLDWCFNPVVQQIPGLPQRGENKTTPENPIKIDD